MIAATTYGMSHAQANCPLRRAIIQKRQGLWELIPDMTTGKGPRRRANCALRAAIMDAEPELGPIQLLHLTMFTLALSFAMIMGLKHQAELHYLWMLILELCS